MTNQDPTSRIGDAKVTKKLAEFAKRAQLTTEIGDFVTRPEPIMNTITSRYPIGENIFQFQWDLLIILDACRVDAIRAVADEFGFITDINSIRSVGSASREWVQKTFIQRYEEEVSNTAYITANPWAKRVLSEGRYLDVGYPNWSTLPIESLGRVEHVWEMREQLEKRAHPEGTSAPEFVTDRAIRLGRECDTHRQGD